MASVTSEDSIIFQGPSQRIDSFLQKSLGMSRNCLHHIIARHDILVNAKPVKKSYTCKPGDHITRNDLSRFADPLILSEAPVIDIEIIEQTPDYLIINKPKGVLSHPNSIRDVKQPSVVGFLYHHFKELPNTGWQAGVPGFLRSGLVHRLDKDTDGLMIIVLSERGLAHFKALFQEKSASTDPKDRPGLPLHKYYTARAHLTPAGEEFLASHPLPTIIDEIVYAKVPHYTPKNGITIIESMTRHEDHTATFELQIITGRTHQIRYHLSTHGLPILGDYMYGIEEEHSLALTASRLKFIDPDGRQKEFTLTK